MTTPLFHRPEGAQAQANAVRAYLTMNDGIEKSWDIERKDYAAKPTIARWENCREQGYVISMRSRNYNKQINIAFFEHRNSDSIHAIKWEQLTLNSPTIDTAQFDGKVYKDKYDTSHSVGFRQAADMAEWIMDELTAWWVASA